MAIEAIRDDFLKEKAVLQEWETRIGSEPPEKNMSQRYKDGWIYYLDKVIATNDEMIALCDAAIANTADTQGLRDKLDADIAAYTEVQNTAAKNGLTLLWDMLQEEINIRAEIRAQV